MGMIRCGSWRRCIGTLMQGYLVGYSLVSMKAQSNDVMSFKTEIYGLIISILDGKGS